MTIRTMATVLGWIWLVSALAILYEMLNLAVYDGSWWKLPAFVGAYVLAQLGYDAAADA